MRANFSGATFSSSCSVFGNPSDSCRPTTPTSFHCQVSFSRCPVATQRLEWCQKSSSSFSTPTGRLHRSFGIGASTSCAASCGTRTTTGDAASAVAAPLAAQTQRRARLAARPPSSVSSSNHSSKSSGTLSLFCHSGPWLNSGRLRAKPTDALLLVSAPRAQASFPGRRLHRREQPSHKTAALLGRAHTNRLSKE